MSRRHVRRLAVALPAPVIGGVLVVLFAGLLEQPEHLPGAPPAHRRDAAPDGSFHGPYVDALFQWQVLERSGAMPLLDTDADGGNLASRAPALAMHPLLFVLARALPFGLAITLLLLVKIWAGAVATFFLARRLGADAIPATVGAVVFALAGGLIDCSTTPADLGLAQSAALFPLLLLLLIRVLERPSIERATALGAVTALVACCGDLVGALATLALAPLSATAWRPLPARDRLRSVLAASVACLGGLFLAAYRWLPAALGSESLIGDVAALAMPWWRGDASVRLPYHLGAVVLVTFLAGVQWIVRDGVEGKGCRRLWLIGIGAAIAVAGPREAIAFVGFFVGLVVSFAFSARSLSGRPLLRHALALGVLGVLLLEAVPAQRPLLVGRAPDEIARAPGWVAFLAQHVEPGARIAVVGPDHERLADALAARRLLRYPHGGVADVDALDDPRDLARAGVGTIVSDLPETRGRFRLLQFLRDDGKYVYRNPAWIGSALLTSRRGMGAEIDVPVPLESGVDRWRCAVDVDAPATLVVALPPVAGISALVDGAEAPVRAHGPAAVAVDLPSGARRVEFVFEPPGLEAGTILSSITLCVLPFLLVLPFLRRRREPPPPRSAPVVVRRRVPPAPVREAVERALTPQQTR